MSTVPSNTRAIVSGDMVRPIDEVSRRASHIAFGLNRLSIGPGTAVAILMRNAISFVEVTQGITMLGAYAVPLNWHLAPPEIKYVLGDCAAQVLFVHADLLDLVPPSVLVDNKVNVIVVRTPDEVCKAYQVSPAKAAVPSGMLELESWIGLQQAWTIPPVPAPESVIYTSGTTGKPKGVRRNPPTAEQRRHLDTMREQVYGLRAGIRLLVPAPMYHAAPNVFAMAGAKVAEHLVLMPKFDAEDFLRLVEQHRITNIVTVPTMFVRLLRLPEAVRRRYDLSSLRMVHHAAAPCPPDVKLAMIEWFGPIIHEWYGTTESSVVTVCNSEEWLSHPGTVGRPIPGARIEVVGEDGVVLPPGSPGELYVGLDFLPDFTYHNRNDDRQQIGRNGLITGGDIGYLDADGFLFLCDRKKDMVISGGVNIYPSEVEAALLSMPAVLDCAVIGIPDAEFGEAVMALVVQDGSTDEAAIRKELSQRLARFKLPKAIEFRDSLPRDDAGKLLKRRLREPYWENATRAI
jgi:long-chain acyl-CoA synthetase